VRRTVNGSIEVGRFEVFLNVGFWHWGSYRIGATRVLQRGPVRIFIKAREATP